MRTLLHGTVFLAVVFCFCGWSLGGWEAKNTPVESGSTMAWANPGDCWGSAWSEPVSDDEQTGRLTTDIGVDNYGYDAHGYAECVSAPFPYVHTAVGSTVWTYEGEEPHECENTTEENNGTWVIASDVVANYSGSGVVILVNAGFAGYYKLHCEGEFWVQPMSPTGVPSFLPPFSVEETQYLAPGYQSFSGSGQHNYSPWQETVPHVPGSPPPGIGVLWTYTALGSWYGENEQCDPSNNAHSLHDVTVDFKARFDGYLSVPTWNAP